MHGIYYEAIHRTTVGRTTILLGDSRGTKKFTASWSERGSPGSKSCGSVTWCVARVGFVQAYRAKLSNRMLTPPYSSLSKNVAPKDVDLSHAEYFRKQVGGRYAKVRVEDIAPENVGQPGCTNAERERFFGILAAGDMVDAYRELIGNDDESALSWRGNTTGKHSGRGMRIDHCIIGRSLLPSISSVEITGHGSDRVGFLGSDHCPVLIKMREKDGGNSDSPQDPANAELRTV